MSDEIRREAGFQNTCWTRVREASDPDERTLAMRALGAICADYWYPIYAYLRRKGHAAPEAEDITQVFFAKLSSDALLAKADPERGKLRTFLLWQLKTVRKSLLEKEAAQKRGGGAVVESIDMTDAEGRYLTEPADPEMSPDELFAKAWAHKVLQRGLDALRNRLASDGKGDEFDALRPFLSLDDAGTASAADVAAQLGITPESARQKIKRMRGAFARELRQEVAESLRDPDESAVNEELANLQAALRSA